MVHVSQNCFYSKICKLFIQLIHPLIQFFNDHKVSSNTTEEYHPVSPLEHYKKIYFESVDTIINALTLFFYRWYFKYHADSFLINQQGWNSFAANLLVLFQMTFKNLEKRVLSTKVCNLLRKLHYMENCTRCELLVSPKLLRTQYFHLNAYRRML